MSGNLSDMRTSSKFFLDLVKTSMLQYNILHLELLPQLYVPLLPQDRACLSSFTG